MNKRLCSMHVRMHVVLSTHPDMPVTATSGEMPPACLYAKPYALVCGACGSFKAAHHLPGCPYVPAVDVLIPACARVQVVPIW